MVTIINQSINLRLPQKQVKSRDFGAISKQIWVENEGNEGIKDRIE